ncbi:hypothetical protein CVT26_005491 [Gymnopilus dilepis]|uniref:Uncharacterized protein n=1 Tax=Gymnopilus dilepis TaxID=231916 RepID=A0A409YT63_9AGAR|nr:hypothetical protein CVT26_005491 [Gymnopilus dilepis]
MRSILYVLISAALASLVSHALPLPGVYEVNEYDARDSGDLVRLESRVFGSRPNPVGPGGRHPEDERTHAQHTRLFHPVPQGTYYETANHAYSHHDVNQHASQLMNALDLATTRNTPRLRKSERTYPKPTSGFRPSEAHRDPASGHPIAYHYPMSATPGNAPHNPHTGRTSMRVGTDRLMAWRHPTDTHFHIGVSYHDPHLPIPPTSRNHPFSAAAPRNGGRFKVGVVKAKKAFGRLLDKVRGRGH